MTLNTLPYRQATHAHLTLEAVNAGEAGTKDIAVYLYWFLFCPTDLVEYPCDVKPGFSKEDLEYAIGRVYWISTFPDHGYSVDVPRWVNFAHNCFKCSGERSGGCSALQTSAPQQKCGIPGNATLLSFDWYAAGSEPTSCLNGTNNCRVDNHMNDKVKETLDDLKNSIWWSYQDIMLIPGTYTGRTDKMDGIGANVVLAKYVDLALTESKVVGLVPFLYKSDPQILTEPNPFKGVDLMKYGEEAERFYQAIVTSHSTTLKDTSLIPIFEYNDDINFDYNTEATSFSDTHYYSFGYETAELDEYQIRRLAFYMKSSLSGIYTQKRYRCVKLRPNFKSSTFFSSTSNCSGVPFALQFGEGYVSPVKQGEADHRILNCRRNNAPYWDQAHVMYHTDEGISITEKCTQTFGVEYYYFTTIGYSKAK